MKKAFNEKLVEVIKRELENEFKEQSEFKLNDTGDICDDICQALELCNKLLTYDYFKESEKIIDTYNAELPKVRAKWTPIYNKELKQKKNDLKKLLTIIVENSEDWC